MPHRGGPDGAKTCGVAPKSESTINASSESDDESLFPITDSGSPEAKETHQGFLNERDLQRTVIRSASNASQTGGRGRWVRYRPLETSHGKRRRISRVGC